MIVCNQDNISLHRLTCDVTGDTQMVAAMPENYTALSQNQSRIWQLSKVSNTNYHHMMQMLWRVGAHCRLDIVEQAFALVVKQFPILTCQIVERDGITYYHTQTFQSTNDKGCHGLPIAFEKIDLRHLNDHEIEGFLRHQLRQPFSEHSPLLLRPFMLQLSHQQTLICIQIHRLLMDENAYHLFNRWLWRFYSQLLPVPILAGQAGACQQVSDTDAMPLPEVTPQYSFRDLNLWEQQMLHNGVGEQHLAYWRENLGGALPLAGLPNDAHRIGGKSEYGCYQVTLLQGLTRRLLSFKQQHSVRTSVVLLAALKALLYRYTGQEDIVVGTPTKGPSLRMKEDFGQFSNILPMRSCMSDALTFRLLLKQLAQTVEKGNAHGDYPLMSLVKDAVVGCYAPFSAFFQVTFNYHFDKKFLPRLSQFDVLDSQLQQHLEQDIAIDVYKGEDSYTLQFRYNGKKYLQDSIARFAEHFMQLLDNLITSPHLAIATVPCMSKSELQQVQLGFNYTQQSLPPQTSFDGFLKQQVADNPHGQAVICDGGGISYEQLNVKANQLADELLFYGIEHRTNVAICLPRSIDLIVAVFATIKVGAAFVLLEPQTQVATKQYILDDVKAKLLVTIGSLQTDLPDSKCRRFLIDQNRAKLALSQQHEPVLKRAIEATDLCQIAYQQQRHEAKPIGIKINHHNLINLAVALDVYEKVTPRGGYWGWQGVFDVRQSALALGQLVLGHGCVMLSERVCEDNQIQEQLVDVFEYRVGDKGVVFVAGVERCNRHAHDNHDGENQQTVINHRSATANHAGVRVRLWHQKNSR